ncbi:MAG: S8 family peptidase [Candidatus Baldrarchaeia archaeon]
MEKRKIFAIVLAVIFLISVIPLAELPAANSTKIEPKAMPATKIDKELMQKIQDAISSNQPNKLLPTIIQTTDKNYNELIYTISELKGTVTYTFKYVSAVAAKIPAKNILKLAENEQIQKIYYDSIIMPAGFQGLEISNINLISTGTVANDLDNLLLQSVVLDSISEENIITLDIQELPETYISYMITGAEKIWDETNYGAEVIVAVIDTGIYPEHPLLSGSVIGGVNLVPGDYSWDDVRNNWHGTFVASQIAAHGVLLLPEDHILVQSLLINKPEILIPYDEGYYSILLFGMAPAAQLYAIKVFPHTGAGAPRSRIMKAIELAIELRDNGTVPIDIINMSLGGPSLFDGHDPEELLVDEATKHGITVVVAAGNDGPAPLRVAAPGTAISAITCAAAADPIHTRVGWDAYLYYMEGIYAPGIGTALFISEDPQIIYFSNRGPTADLRLKPDITATGVFNFGAFPPNYVGWASGTSFSTPIVAGAAALLISYAKTHNLKLSRRVSLPELVKMALITGADDMDYPVYAQGAGFLNVEKSLKMLKNWQKCLHKYIKYVHRAYKELTEDLIFVDLEDGIFEAEIEDLEPGHAVHLILKVDKSVDAIWINITNVEFESRNYVLGMDSIEFYVSNVYRGGIDAYYWWGVNIIGDSAFLLYSDLDFTPGYIRITLEGDWTNWGSVDAVVSIGVVDVDAKVFDGFAVVKNDGMPVQLFALGYEGYINEFEGAVAQDELAMYMFEIPPDAATVIFELNWMHDWSAYPTHDLDLYVKAPNGTVFVEGATLDVPEFVVIDNPSAYGEGPWYVFVVGWLVYLGAEPFELSMIVIKSWTPTFAFELGVVHHFAVFPVYGDGVLAIVGYLKFFGYDLYFFADFEEM